MKHFLRKFVVPFWFVLLCAGLAGCDDSVEEGTFSITFTWSETKPSADEELYAWGEVFRVENEERTQVAESNLVQFQAETGANLSFPDVPNGQKLVLVVNLAAAMDKNERPLYFGESKPFTLKAGLDVIVEVSLTLAPTPAIEQNENFANGQPFEFYMATGPVSCPDCYTKTPLVNLRFLAGAASRVLVSNRKDFPSEARLDVNLSDLTPNDQGAYMLINWSLHEGLEETSEGEHSVYMKLLNERDYESPLYARTITLDTTPPSDPAVGSSSSLLFAEDEEHLYVELVFSAKDRDEMFVQACTNDCTGSGDSLENGLVACDDADCLSAVGEWIPYRTRGRVKLSDSTVTKIRVRYRDYARNETDWAAYEVKETLIYPLSWVTVPAGFYEMGCAEDDFLCGEAELPRHPVHVSVFQLMATPVTQAFYETLTGLNPSDHPACAECPVFNVNWYDADDFCKKIGGRLPTEAEWEYAARAGSASKYSCGETLECLEDIAWHAYNSWSDEVQDLRVQPVGQKQANAYGLYDMLGNIDEWVEDCYHRDDFYYGAPMDGSAWVEGDCATQYAGGITETLKMLRGGSYRTYPKYLRPSLRRSSVPGSSNTQSGLRCARDIDQEDEVPMEDCGMCLGNTYCLPDGSCSDICENRECGPSIFDVEHSCGECGDPKPYCDYDGDCGIAPFATWTDEDTGLIWQAQNYNAMDTLTWEQAGAFCDEDIGHGWRLPTLDEVRTLVRNCPATMAGGSCNVGESSGCLSEACMDASCVGCEEWNDIREDCYLPTPMKDFCGAIWTSTGAADDETYVWSYRSSNGGFERVEKSTNKDVLCVQ